MTLHFSPEYVYMYKGFTHPNYRGQRLHAIGMNLALQEYLDRGYRGLVSYIESNNFSSLKSAYRVGYRDFGRVAVWKIFGARSSMPARAAASSAFSSSGRPIGRGPPRPIAARWPPSTEDRAFVWLSHRRPECVGRPGAC